MSASPLATGTAVDRYTIEALIGRGGMGEVYRALDGRLRRKVALKIVRTDADEASPGVANPDGVARLFREARAAAALTHPNTVAIHDLGESEDGLFYIVMELVVGQPLLAYVGDERVSLARRLKWLAEIARALATAHKAGVIHRDVKPSNVMVSEEDVAKVLDFGLAKPLPKAADEPESFGFKTQAGRVLGTIRYMAPEQMIGGEADGRSDQYALGMTAYELLAGRYPPGKAFDVPPLLNTVVTGFPADGALAIARMLKRIPEDRFASMEDVASAFEDIAQNRPVRALGVMPGPKPARKPMPSVIPTMQEPPVGVGSTLQSAAKKDELSTDTQAAVEEALEPTVSPSELAEQRLALAKTMLPEEPPRTPKLPPREPATSKTPGPVISTLQSADAGDAVAAVRKATSKAPEEPTSKPITVGGSTLASGQANDTVLELRAATSKTPKEPVAVESAPPPPEKPVIEKPIELTTTASRQAFEPPAKKNNTLLIVLAIVFLAIAAFAGNYLGARSRAN